MKVIRLGEHSSVINSHMAQQRDVQIQKNKTLFRKIKRKKYLKQ